MKTNTNLHHFCPCGSGKKYKKCCYAKDSALDDLHQKFMNNELPFRAEIRSSNGQSSSFKVYNAKIVKNGVETTLFDDDITLSTNTVNGDKTESSFAILSVPTKSNSSSEIKISGNASVENKTGHYAIEILNNPKKLKIRSPKGLFAIIRVVNQRNVGFDFFDILFGIEGQDEIINTEGNKERPHIAIYPDGNGKFIRLLGHKCDLKSELSYNPSIKVIFPEKITVTSVDFEEKLVLSFEFHPESSKAILNNAVFE